MDNLDIYRNSSIITLREVPKIIRSWIIILLVSILFFGSLSILFKYKKFLTYEAYVKEGCIEFYVDKEFFSKANYDTVIINDQEYKYTIIAIDTYSYDMGEPYYWKITMESQIPRELVVENNRLILKFLDEETTFMKSIIKKIKKGLE